ncbi:MAG: peptidoglycan DD-metalloendopeptidase family protein [bacterium]
MDRREGFSLLLVPRGTDARHKREIRLSGTQLVLLTAGLLGALLAFVAMAASFGYVMVDQVRYHTLERENRVLRAELDQMNEQVLSLADQMSVIAQRDEAVRLAAELDPIAEDLRQAGIGGSHRDFNRDVLMLAGETGGMTRELQGRINRLLREAKLESESLLEVEARLAESESFLTGYPSIFPIDQTRYRTWVTSPFGWRSDPLYGTRRFHEGNDVGAAHGTPIRATADGIVAGWENGVEGFQRIGLGNFIRIDHQNGYVTSYGHMARVAPGIRKGVRVKRGQVIGYVGRTGRAAGTHLHYEITYNDQPVNPFYHYYTDRVADATGRKQDLPTYPESGDAGR